MASVIAIESDVFAGYFEEIDVSVEIRVKCLGFAAPQVYRVYWLALKRPRQDSE